MFKIRIHFEALVEMALISFEYLLVESALKYSKAFSCKICYSMVKFDLANDPIWLACGICLRCLNGNSISSLVEYALKF